MAGEFDLTSANQFLTIFAWFPTALLAAVLMLIARFYQKQSNVNTRFRWFLVPVVLYGIAAARYSMVDLKFGDAPAAVLMAVGGLSLGWLCLSLYRRMTAGR